MDFKKYNSIENSYRTKFINQIVEEGHGDKEFVVQEKVHGANFSFWINQEGVKIAKRSGFIEESDKFYNCRAIEARYKEQMLNLWKSFPEDVEIVVFGELYGGHYPFDKEHVKASEGAVQKGVSYHTKQDFIAFDVMINGKYTDVDTAYMLLEKYEIPTIPVLFKGSLQECLNYSNEFESQIYALHGLPKIENNICEGTVIRPIEATFLFGRERLILKNKNEKFTEKHGGKKEPKEKTVEKLSPEVESVLNSFKEYVNENRLRNVLSKIGQVTERDFPIVMKSFAIDVIEDATKDHREALEKLEKKDQKLISKKVNAQCASLIRSNFLNIVDGTF